MLRYGFYNPVNGDRKYTADDLNDILNGLVSNGVIPNVGDEFFVTAGEAAVTVGTGKAIIDKIWTRNTEAIEFAVDILNTSPRYDAIYLKIDKEARENSFIYLEGEASDDPVKPQPVEEDSKVYFPIAYLLSDSGEITVEDARVFATMVLGSQSEDEEQEEENITLQAEIGTGVVTADASIKAGDPVSFWDGKVRAHVVEPLTILSSTTANGAMSNVLCCTVDSRRTVFIWGRMLSYSSNTAYVHALRITTEPDGSLYSTQSSCTIYFQSPSTASYNHFDIALNGIFDGVINVTATCRAYNQIQSVRILFWLYDGVTYDQPQIVATSDNVSTSVPNPQIQTFNKNGDYFIAYYNANNSWKCLFFDRNGTNRGEMTCSGRNCLFATMGENRICYASQHVSSSSSYQRNGYYYIMAVNPTETGSYYINMAGYEFSNLFDTENAYFTDFIPNDESSIHMLTTDNQIITFFVGNPKTDSNDQLSLEVCGYTKQPRINIETNDGYADYKIFNKSKENNLPIIIMPRQNNDIQTFLYDKEKDGNLVFTGLDGYNYGQIAGNIKCGYCNGILAIFGQANVSGSVKFGAFYTKFNLDNAVALEDGEPGDVIKVAQSGYIHLPTDVSNYTTMGIRLCHIKDDIYKVIW